MFYQQNNTNYTGYASFYPIIVIRSISFYQGSEQPGFIMQIQGHR